LTLHLPTIADTYQTATSPKKGVSLWPGSCDLLLRLGVSWYYAGQHCETIPRVPYLTNAWELKTALEGDPPDSAHVMFWNEPDLAHWHSPPVEEAVNLFLQVEKTWPEKIWIGPCLAGDPLYLRRFWTEYQKQTGHPPDPKTHRLCLHCYADALTCAHQIDSHLSNGAIFGLDRIWLTEFGLHLGTTRSIDQTIAQNAALVACMEADPRVERYAYWSALIPDYGYLVPSKPISGFHPLAFYWLNLDGSKEERLTDMGEWYATAPGGSY
jgi:hypothetical protein